MSMSRDYRVGNLRLFGLVPARYECGSAAFRAESLWLSVNLLQNEAMPLRRSLDTNQLMRKGTAFPHGTRQSRKRSRCVKALSALECLLSDFGTLDIGLWTFVYSIEKYFASG
jgi:hypothetical protein